MGVDSVALRRRRPALRAGDVGVGRALQKSWRVERENRALHELALFAVGHQAAVESGRGHFENAAAMDLGDAIFAWRAARGRGADDSRAAFFPTDARIFLAAGI